MYVTIYFYFSCRLSGPITKIQKTTTRYVHDWKLREKEEKIKKWPSNDDRPTERPNPIYLYLLIYLFVITLLTDTCRRYFRHFFPTTSSSFLLLSIPSANSFETKIDSFFTGNPPHLDISYAPGLTSTVAQYWLMFFFSRKVPVYMLFSMPFSFTFD